MLSVHFLSAPAWSSFLFLHNAPTVARDLEYMGDALCYTLDCVRDTSDVDVINAILLEGR